MKFYQDGGQFYDEETGELIADYGDLVTNDSDTKGASEARILFLEMYPQYEEL